MAHPLYYHCIQHLNKPVTVYLNSGKSRCGILNQVTNNGIYLTPSTGYSSAIKSKERYQVETADNPNEQYSKNVEEAFWPFFIPFAVLTGFTLGFVTGAIVTRPYPFYW